MNLGGLLGLTIITGTGFLVDGLFFKPRRRRNALREVAAFDVVHHEALKREAPETLQARERLMADLMRQGFLLRYTAGLFPFVLMMDGVWALFHLPQILP